MPPLPACLPFSLAPLLQGNDVVKYKEQLKEKDVKINELVEDLGNKELLLSEAQVSLAKVRAAAGRFGQSGSPCVPFLRSVPWNALFIQQLA